MLFSCFELTYECFYANADSSLFRGLKVGMSYFWQTVLKTWIDGNRVNSSSSGCTMLWNNRNIKYQGQVVFFKDWIKAGIMYVADIATYEGIVHY